MSKNNLDVMDTNEYVLILIFLMTEAKQLSKYSGVFNKHQKIEKCST